VFFSATQTDPQDLTSLALYTTIPTDLESETTANQKTREVK